MKIENQLRIMAREDNCCVRLADGEKIFIGSITIGQDECGDFINALSKCLYKLKKAKQAVPADASGATIPADSTPPELLQAALVEKANLT
jgi:hypothetical protein